MIDDRLVKQAGQCYESAKAALEAGDFDHWQYCRDQLRELLEAAAFEPASWVYAEIKGLLAEMPIPINPPLPAAFDDTPNDERSPEEIARWWAQPYIVPDTFDDQGDNSYDEYVARMKSYGDEPGRSRAEWEADKATHRQNWFVWFPSGIRYEVRRLDGGAWDRATSHGIFSTLDEALACAQALRR
jgi:hypothetical protein